MTSTTLRRIEEGPRRRITEMGGRHKLERRSRNRATSDPILRTRHQDLVMKKKRLTSERRRRRPLASTLMVFVFGVEALAERTTSAAVDAP
jgi:hypothetical protein